MSRAPSTIHIKRKATDDPVDVLRKEQTSPSGLSLTITYPGVHELNGKRQRRATEFVFTRQPAEASATATDGVASAQPSLTGRRPIKPLPRSGVSQIAGLPAATSATATHKHEATVKEASPAGQPDSYTANNKTSQQTPLDAGSELTPLQVAQHRRFHISRTSTSGGRQSPVIGGKVQKRSPTVFIERRPQPLVSRDVTPVNKTGLPTSATTPETEQSRPLKKPGLAARTTSKQTSQPDSAKLAPPTARPARNIRLPSGLVMPWDVTSDKLAQELQAYTLQEIGRAVAESESTDPNSHPDPQSSMYSIRKKGPSKFKPKKPLLRYHERHPEVAAPSPAQNMEVDSTDEDGEYIIDTYIRMPADQVGWDWQENFGYLVLESQPDIDEFYHEDSDHSETEEYDEEDENGKPRSLQLKLFGYSPLQPRIITQPTTQRRRSSPMTNTTATRTITVIEMRQMMRSLTRMIQWTMMTTTMLQDTHGASRSYLPG